MQKIEVIVRITKGHCPPQEQTIFEWIEMNRAAPDTLNYPGLEINLEHRRVFKNGQEVYMSRYEYGVLSLMARHPGQLFTKEQIFEAVWHQDSESCLTAVTNTIGRIRQKIEDDRAVPVYIRTIQNWKFQRGDIFFTRFDNAIGSEQSGNRPAVVLQNDVGNFYSPTLIVATLTSKAAKKYTQPTHCLLVNEFLSVPSIVQAEQIFTVDKSRVLKYLGHLTPEEMSRVDDAVRASLALNPLGSIQRLPPIIRSTAAYAPPEVVDGKPPLYPYTPIKSSFEDAGSVEDMMLYTELEAAVHAMIQRLEYSFTFNPSLLTIPKRKQQVAEILKEAETYIWRIKEEMRCA